MVVIKEIKGKKVEFNLKISQTGQILWNTLNTVNPYAEDGMFVAKELNDEYQAVVFTLPKKINGEKVAGITLSDEQFTTLVSQKEELLKKKEDEYNKKEQEAMMPIIEGSIKIKARHHDHPNYVPGHVVDGYEGKALRDLGVARYIDGLGTKVDADLIEELGVEFTFSQAKKYAESKKEEKNETEKELNEIQEKIEEAKLTGYPVKIMSWTEECDDPKEECSLDRVTVYALSDGSKKTVREHTW